MSGKLLVVGDSFADRYYETRRELKYEPINLYWFEKLRDELNLELINLSKCGSGNKQIFDKAFDRINNEKNISLVVIVWSEFGRVDLETKDNDYIEYNPEWCRFRGYSKMKDKFFLMWEKAHEYYELDNQRRGVDNFLRYTISLTLLAKEKGIKIIQFFGCTPTYSFSTINYLLSCDLLHKLDEKDYIGYPFLKDLGGFSMQEKFKEPYHVVSLKDKHPNQKGNDLILKFIMEKYEKIINSR